MEPRIQYAKTSDGVSIAYWAAGEGVPFVQLPLIPWSHVQVEWQQAPYRGWYERLMQNRTVIRYDARGTGLSDRTVTDLSLDALVLDLQAVVDRLQLERFSLFGMFGAGRVALAYAAQHPERVSHLLLWCSYARGQDWRQSPQAETLVTLTGALMEEDWETYTKTRAHVVLGWSERETTAQLATLMQESVTPAMFRAFSEALDHVDVTNLLAQIQAPTLVLHRKQVPHPPIDAARSLVSAIPDAHLMLLEGKVVVPWTLEDSESVVAAMDQFQGLTTQAPSILPPMPATVAEPGRTDATIRTAAAPEKSFSSGRYAVRRVLGEGGQKIVYLVHDTALDRECALSVIKRDLLEPDDLLRLQREAQSMARLGAHSTIVTIFDIGEEDGTPYIVCEYVPGGDLRHELRRVGTLSLDRALAIAADVTEALVIAHAHGVVHRDVKPSNVWIRENGTAKLGDFGLAFSLDRSRLTMPGTFLGTASYMPPEQALGRPAEPRSDLYSLGAILYEMVTGAPPFVDDDILSVISQHVNATPVPPIAQNPDLPPALDALILHLLAKSPDDRPASASEVAAELRSLRRTAAHTS